MKELLHRIIAIVNDMAIVALSIVMTCVIAFGVVHLFRLFGTGHRILAALAQCGTFFEAALWPVLVLIGFVVFRRQIFKTMNEFPGFVRNYSPAEKFRYATWSNEPQKVLVAERHTGAHKQSDNGQPNHNSGSVLEDRVMTELQYELGVEVKRDVILFDDKTQRFDGIVVRGDKITAVEVRTEDKIEAIESVMREFARFYCSISREDQKHFDVMMCLSEKMRSHIVKLVELRSRIPFVVEFRFLKF